MIKKLDHIAIVVKDLERALQIYQNTLGLKLDHIEEMPQRAIKVAFLEICNVHIELIAQTSSSSEISNFLEKRGEGLNHICFEVDDIKSEIEKLKSSSLKTTTNEPKPGAGEKPVIFFHPKDLCGVLVELIEKQT